MAFCVRLLKPAWAVKSLAPTASAPITNNKSSGCKVVKLPDVRGDRLPVLLLILSITVRLAAPVHSSIIRIPSAPARVSVTVTTRPAVAALLIAYQPSTSNEPELTTLPPRIYRLPAVSVGVLALLIAVAASPSQAMIIILPTWVVFGNVALTVEAKVVSSPEAACSRLKGI